jgi:translation elongation factor EF-1beta
MKSTEVNHSKLLKELSESTSEKWVAHHREPKAGGFNVLELRLQDNNKEHDTEYFKKKFIKNGFTEVKNKSILEEQSAVKKIKPFTGEGPGVKVEISSDNFGRTFVRLIIDKKKLKEIEVKKLEQTFKEEFINKNKIKTEVKHQGGDFESLKNLFKRAA